MIYIATCKDIQVLQQSTPSVYHTIIESPPSPTSKKACNPRQLYPSLFGFTPLVRGLQTTIFIRESIKKH